MTPRIITIIFTCVPAQIEVPMLPSIIASNGIADKPPIGHARVPRSSQTVARPVWRV